MNIMHSELLIDSYLDWYKSKVSFKELKDATAIITPYVNHINDRIILFTEVQPNQSIRLSDDGMTFNELEMMSLNIDTEVRKKIINETLKNFNIRLDNNVLSTTAKNIHDFPQQKHNLIQCILRFYDLLFTDTHNVRGLFKEEVLNFLFENDFGGNVSPKFQGGSGIVHSVDYALGATKSRPNTLMKFQNNPNFSSVTEQKFIADDLKSESSLKAHGFKYIMITGKESPGEKVRQAAKFSGVELIYYKDKEKLLEFK